jgi:hypothetical protein
MALVSQGKQPMSNGKGKGGKSGAGGGPSTQAAAGSSGQGSSRPSASSARPIGFRTEEVPVQAPPPLAAEAAGATQQAEPQPAGGSTKKDKEKLRKERQRQRKTEEAWEALQGAIELMKEAAGNVGALEEAMQAASKHGARSEPLAALVAVARELIEQARAAEAERVRVAAEAAEAAAAVEAVERSQMEKEMAALTLSVQSHARRMQSDRLRLLQMQAQLGVPPAAPAPHPDDAEENQCVMCFDAPKDHIIIPCYHVCVCEACANLLTQMSKPLCPICRTAIQHTNKVFHS